MFFPFDLPLFPQQEKPQLFLDLFDIIKKEELKTKDIELYSKIDTATKNIASYFEKSVLLFPSLFEKSLESFEDSLTYLEKIAIPNNCVCAGVIDDIPGWRCKDCSKFENTVYCNDCFKISQDLHKGHNICYLPNCIGMCDCGDPLALKIYCKNHSGPFTEQKQIDDYIQKSFGEKIVENLRKFFDEFFLEFSKYLILTERFELFFCDMFNEKFKNANEELIKEKDDVALLKSNFCIVLQNFIKFLRLITKKNSGMVQLIANYFLKNNFGSIKLEDEYLTEHRCIEASKNDIKILYDGETKEKHICKCPFLSIFLSNYREEVKLDKEDEQQFIYSFAQNLQLRSIFCILYFFNYKYMLYNNNENVLYCRTQFYLEDSLELIVTKTSFLEDSIDILYNYVLNAIKAMEIQNKNLFDNQEMVKKIFSFILELYGDIKYYSKSKMRLVMTEQTSYFKKAIDLLSLFQNIDKYKSIFPHPPFQEKNLNIYVFQVEKFLMIIPRLLNCCIDWKNIEKLKEIYKHLINKILNQKEEGIKQLEDNEYSFHLELYRVFGIFVNAFCFNYSFINNCTLLDSINFFKKTFFESKEQIENLVDICLKNYYKFFGFIFGTKNNFFNYYDRAIAYFKIYMEFDIYEIDFNCLKYLFALTEKEINIDSLLKMSNIENVYEKFDKIYNLGKIEEEEPIPEPQENKPENTNEDLGNLSEEEPRRLLMRLLNNENQKTDKSRDETNIMRQWENLLELLILITKNNSCCYYNLINNYDEVLSTETKTKLFDTIKNNKFAMEDLKDLLKEKIMINVISSGNLIDMKNLEKNINKNLLFLFDENNIYNQTLDELTHNKMDGETKIFYLKDQYLKYIDYNNYVKPNEKTTAQKYVLDFKKDIVKIYNYYFYNNSELTFEFFRTIYEKVFLSKNNFELISKIFEKLLNDDKISVYLEKKSIINSLLPTLLNYLQIFNVINTKSFIEFKLQNKNSIKNLYELLFNFVKNNDKKNIIDKDLEDNLKDVINQMNRYQLIYDSYGGDLSKLNKYDYNTNILDQLRQNQKSNTNNINLIPEETNKNDEKEKELKAKKDKIKSLMKKKSNNFMKKIESNEDILKAINEHIDDVENSKDKNKDDEIMCFYCRNSINLKSFEKPYGKLGIANSDLFYINSIKATLREELHNLGIKDEDNKLYSELSSQINKQPHFRINSCGHYFHNSCFEEGYKKGEQNGFTCPLCLKEQNTLIPPLNLFHDKYNILKSEELSYLTKDDEKEIKEETEDINNLYNIAIKYILSIEIIKKDVEKYDVLLEEMFPNYKALFNYFENIFYSDGTTFHKQQQIDNMKNLILSLRLTISNSKDCKKSDIAKYIKETLLKLVNGPEDNIFIYQYQDSYMHYLNLFEKILLSLQILFDFDEIKETFKYILCIFLPYFFFGLYYKKLIIEKKNNNLNLEQIKQKLNINEFKKYLNEDNKQIIQNFTSLLRRFCFIKLISDYKNKNEDIINCINELTMKNILSIIDMNDLSNLPEQETKIEDIINNLYKAISEKDILYQLFSPYLNFDKIINSILENANKFSSDENIKLTQELIIQFTPIKFKFIKLDNNVFDFLLKYIEKKCVECKQLKKESLVCLICGERVCHPIRYQNYHALDHANKCTEDFSFFIDTNELYLYCADNDRLRKLCSLYVDKNGSGLKKNEITNEFNLSDEKYKLALKNYIAQEYVFK